VAIQADGKIVVVGSNSSRSSGSSDSDFVLKRFNADGTPDTNFGQAGRALIDITQSGETSTSLALTSDGSIIVAGMSSSASQPTNSTFETTATIETKKDGTVSDNDVLALVILSFVFFVTASGFLFLGRRWMMAAVFPFAFLMFMVPMPDGMVGALETASQYASVGAAELLFRLGNTPHLHDGIMFQLPGITLEVAQECSGIRSSWVLFITSILSANLFLRTNWKRVVLVALVIPLGILRNGFRVWVIGMLCVRFGPHMIDSPIHHQGGPLFFILSLVPLFILIVFLRRSEDEAVDRLAGGVGHNA